MKNKSSLTDNEKDIVLRFTNMKYPSIYKTDETDSILFVELVDFDVCPYLLGKRSINSGYSYVLSEYERYLAETDTSLFDEYAKEHYILIVKIMELFKKYYPV